EWQEKASKVEQLEKNTLALQNTIDHLEHRLEIANVEKIDAEEQLFNIQSQRTPFDPKPPKLQVPLAPAENRQSTRTSMSTKTRQSDVHIEQLRTAIIEREATIGEKDRALRMVERQLEHHQLLLQAEIKRHATITLLADIDDDPLPDLTSLASKEDIERWIERLQNRLKKEREKSKSEGKKPIGDLESVVEDLRKEIDFYVREIIYYKLDIRGYKSDIKKLKSFAARMGN
ncbi:hypothetical protein BU26DRAFT_394377, partial [Trematosphaeria pertusa]